LGGKSVMRIYWTSARDVAGAKSTGKYQPQTETIALPSEFWSDLKQVLGLLVQTRLAELTFDQPGLIADRLTPLIAQVRALVESKEGVSRNPSRGAVPSRHCARLRGRAVRKEGTAGREHRAHRKVLDENTRERVPLGP
jgi:hypothetical protein